MGPGSGVYERRRHQGAAPRPLDAGHVEGQGTRASEHTLQAGSLGIPTAAARSTAARGVPGVCGFAGYGSRPATRHSPADPWTVERAACVELFGSRTKVLSNTAVRPRHVPRIIWNSASLTGLIIASNKRLSRRAGRGQAPVSSVVYRPGGGRRAASVPHMAGLAGGEPGLLPAASRRAVASLVRWSVLLTRSRSPLQ